MKLGIVIQHYDARNDVRDLVDLLARDHEVVLFGHKDKLASIDTRLIRRSFRQKNRPANAFWSQAFNLFGNIPASRANFLVTELFKLASLPPWHRAIAAARLRLRLGLPSLVAFDRLLDAMRGVDTTPVADIERFLVITELSSPAFLARVLESGIPVDAYVYSWDHACKHATFSQRVDRWFVWHGGIADDLVTLQGIDRRRISVVGATQLSFVHEYLATPVLRARKLENRYVYYGCGVGHIAMARQEARLIAHLADTLAAVAPDLLLIVRPYPMLADTEFLREVRRRPNVRFDEDFLQGRHDRSLTREAIFARLNLQEHAAAFVHAGTTMGLEGAYLETPVLFLDPRDFDYGVSCDDFMYLGRFIHQYHNERYMILDDFPNVVTRSADLPGVLTDVLNQPARFLAYNRRVARDLPLRSLSEVASDLVSAGKPE